MKKANAAEAARIYQEANEDNTDIMCDKCGREIGYSESLYIEDNYTFCEYCSK